MKFLLIACLAIFSMNSMADTENRSSSSDCVTPTITAGAYSVGDVVGGQMDFDNALGLSEPSGLLRSIRITDHSATRAPFELVCFDQDFTEVADNGVATYSVADASHAVLVVSVVDTDYVSLGLSNFAALHDIDKVVRSTDEQVRCQLKVVSAVTFNDVNELTVCLEIQKDAQ